MRRLLPPVSPPAPPSFSALLGVRGGGPGAWPAGGARARGGPAAAAAAGANHARGRSRSTVAGPAGDGREGPGRVWERKRTLCPPPCNSRRCHGTSPFPSPSPRPVPSPRAAWAMEMGRRLSFPLACPQTRVSSPFGGHAERGGGWRGFSVPPRALGGAGRRQRGPGSRVPAPFIPPCAGLTSPHPSPPPGPFPALLPRCPPQHAACPPCRRCFPGSVSASLDVVRHEVRLILVLLPAGAGRGVVCPLDSGS